MHWDFPENYVTGGETFTLHDPFGIPVNVQGGVHAVELQGVVDYCVVHLLVQDIITGETYVEKVTRRDATSGRTIKILVGEMPGAIDHVVWVE
jgi:hypothetical protein